MQVGMKLVCALAAIGLGLGISRTAFADALTVKTEQGKVQGKTINDGKVKAFLGLPYAAPPVAAPPVVVTPLVNEGSATTVTRRTTTSYSAAPVVVESPPPVVVTPPVGVTAPGTVTQSTTTYASPSDSSSVTAETVGSVPAVTTTYRQKTYTTTDY